MKKVLLFWCFVVCSITNSLSQDKDISKLAQPPENATKQTPVLCEKLSIFEPFVGKTWIGAIPGDRRMGDISLKWEIILNGFAVRLERIVLNHKRTTETIYYWDEPLGEIAYLTITNNGYLTTGTVSCSEKEFISEGLQSGHGIERQARRIYKIDKEGTLTEDDQFRGSENEEWQRTHISIYSAKR